MPAHRLRPATRVYLPHVLALGAIDVASTLARAKAQLNGTLMNPDTQ